MRMDQQKSKGFTLLELLLVLAISSSLVVLMLNYTTQKSDEMRRDKTVLQMQQILNAGLSYYVNNSSWPVTGGCGGPTPSLVTAMLTPNYIPQTTPIMANSYGAQSYYLNCMSTGAATNPPTPLFYVYTQINTPVNASIIAGRLPMAFATTLAGAQANPPTQDATCKNGALGPGCTNVVSFVNIPGQNLNNARSVNFAGTYSSGACVPAPNCPAGMKAEIFVVPASVNGVFDDPNCAAGPSCPANTYPMSSFTAFAVGKSTTDPSAASVGTMATGANDPTGATGPLDCSVPAAPWNMPCVGASASAYSATSGANWGAAPTDPAGTLYWRVCLAVMTSKGPVVVNGVNTNDQEIWAAMKGSLVAFTRCAPNNGSESPSGTSFGVWQNNYNFGP